MQAQHTVRRAAHSARRYATGPSAGQAVIEYMLLLGMISLIGFTGMSVLGEVMQDQYATRIGEAMRILEAALGG